MIERSVVLVKPDGVERNIIGNILSCYEDNGLKIVALKLMRATEKLLKSIIVNIKEKTFMRNL